MSQAESPTKQKSKTGCYAFSVLVALAGGFIGLGLLIAFFTYYHFRSEGHGILEPQASEVEQSVDAPPPSEGNAPPEGAPDSTGFDPTSCLPQPDSYSLEIQNLNDRTSSSGEKHVCGADGLITNTSNQTLMFSVFRINKYGAEETKYPEGKWRGTGYTYVGPGETVEYGGFYRCTGPGCDGDEWYFIQRMSILVKAPGCIEYALGFEDKPPVTIVPIENPCSW